MTEYAEIKKELRRLERYIDIGQEGQRLAYEVEDWLDKKRLGIPDFADALTTVTQIEEFVEKRSEPGCYNQGDQILLRAAGELNKRLLFEALYAIALNHVNRGRWNPIDGYSALREILKGIGPGVPCEAFEAEELANRLCSLPDEELEALIDQLEPRLQKAFPDMKR